VGTFATEPTLLPLPLLPATLEEAAPVALLPPEPDAPPPPLPPLLLLLAEAVTAAVAFSAENAEKVLMKPR
jgi:hypothetical protein